MNLELDTSAISGPYGRVRLNLLKTTTGPSIWEFQLFEPEKR
jgi:hypothetical protein